MKVKMYGQDTVPVPSIKMKISPSLLSADFANLKTELEKITDAQADLLHLDVMDGHYVPNLTYGIPIIRKIRKVSNIPFDVHLMVTNPASYIDQLSEIGRVDYISWHPETEFHNHRLIHKIKSYGIKAGWALNPATPVDIIKPVLDDIDFVLLMSVNPGFPGQKFISSVYQKLQEVQLILAKSSKSLEIQIDGGVNAENAPKLARLGANILVAGSYIFKSDDYSQAILNLKSVR